MSDRVYKPEELVFAAYERCPCGLGMAHVKDCGAFGPMSYWDCSGILMGTADVNAKHTGEKPFTFWEILSERQPSANGSTTRP